MYDCTSYPPEFHYRVAGSDGIIYVGTILGILYVPCMKAQGRGRHTTIDRHTCLFICCIYSQEC